MAGAPDNEPFYADLLYKVWQHLSSSQEEQRLGALYSRLKDISAKVEIQAEELLLSHYIPGKCRACKNIVNNWGAYEVRYLCPCVI